MKIYIPVFLTGFIAATAFLVSCGGSGTNSAQASAPSEQMVCRSRFSSPMTPNSQVDYCFEANGTDHGSTFFTISELFAKGWRIQVLGSQLVFNK